MHANREQKKFAAAKEAKLRLTNLKNSHNPSSSALDKTMHARPTAKQGASIGTTLASQRSSVGSTALLTIKQTDKVAHLMDVRTDVGFSLGSAKRNYQVLI
ncbi:hypothetical protein [Bordetella holmesii]|uniref:hypothetical protein n=1 Tax=Bordetella holmesii TaxID=35814 RepID=UPI0012D32667|nr:hypothetical protein [Bordetella holmesii]